MDDPTPTVTRGRLIKAYVPHVDQIPRRLTLTGRGDDPTNHNKAMYEISALDFNSQKTKSKLPVAAMTSYENDDLLVYRGKARPVLVLGNAADLIPRSLTEGKPKWQTTPAYLVAPFYGVDEGTGRRSGFAAPFVERVRHCEYSHLFWETLPIGGAEESLLRLDHLLPISTERNTMKVYPFRLSDEALSLVDEYLQWHLFEDLASHTMLYFFKEQLATMPPQPPAAPSSLYTPA